MSVVLDASAAVEVLLATAEGERVLQLVAAEDALAPAHFDAEIANAVARIERAGEIDPAVADGAIGDLAALPVERVPIPPLLAAAWAHRHNVRLHDALYVALAAALDCPLVTADARLARAPHLGIALTLVT